MNTNEILDAIKERHSLPSDYAVHKLLGVTYQQISNYRKGKSLMGDEAALKAAELLQLPPDYLLACLHAERSSDQDVQRVWSGLADKLKKTSAATTAVIFALLFTGDPDGGAMAANSNIQRTQMVDNPALYIMSTLKRWFGRAMAGLFGGSHAPIIAHA